MKPAHRMRIRRGHSTPLALELALPSSSSSSSLQGSSPRHRQQLSMARRGRRALIAAISVILLVSYLYYHIHLRRPTHLSKASSSISSKQDLPRQRGKPKITIIVPWQSKGDSTPPYVPYFFSSVQANPSVDLLFIRIVSHQDDCTPYWNAQNVKEVCLSDQEYYEVHAQYLCERWNCTPDEKTYLLNYIIKQGVADGNKTFFRLFRNGVFRRWIDPDTTIWGWCDVDTYWGNFERVFPWDIAHDFDVIAIAAQPDTAEERLIFTRGHMAFLANTPEMTDKLFSYKKFTTLRSFLSAPPFLFDAEESEFSHFLFAENTNITFIHLEGMVNNFDAAFFSEAGTFYTPIPDYQMTPEIRKRLMPLIRPRNKPRQPTFSENGVESPVTLLPGKDYSGGLWFDSIYAQFVRPDWTEFERKQKAIFMRRVPGGPLSKRWEPRERFLQKDGDIIVDECLYKHFQEEKRKPWFKRLPPNALKSGQAMYQIGDKEVQILDKDGEVVFKTSSES